MIKCLKQIKVTRHEISWVTFEFKVSRSRVDCLSLYEITVVILLCIHYINFILNTYMQKCSRLSVNFLSTYMLCSRCLMVSTNQADPGCFYFRISWILMEQCWFYFFHPLHFLQGLRSLKHWLFQKLSMKIFKKDFIVKFTLILMIKKRPLTFSKLKK